MDAPNWPTDSNPIEIAAELNRLEPKKRTRLLQQMPMEMIDSVLWQLEPNDQAVRLLESMDPDDRIHLFQSSWSQST